MFSISKFKDSLNSTIAQAQDSARQQRLPREKGPPGTRPRRSSEVAFEGSEVTSDVEDEAKSTKTEKSVDKGSPAANMALQVNASNELSPEMQKRLRKPR